MIITVAVTVCHLITTSPAPDFDQPDVDDPIAMRQASENSASDQAPSSHLSLCHEEKVAEIEASMAECAMSQPEIADWKSRTRFAAPDWYIQKIRCVPGSYTPMRDNI